MAKENSCDSSFDDFYWITLFCLGFRFCMHTVHSLHLIGDIFNTFHLWGENGKQALIIQNRTQIFIKLIASQHFICAPDIGMLDIPLKKDYPNQHE